MSENNVKEDIKENSTSVNKTQDFETTDGAAEANVGSEKKKNKKSKHEIKIEELEAEIKKLKEETKKDREAYLLAKADLANVRKRVEENAIIDRKYASLNLVSDLVGPCDMLKKACAMQTDDVQMKNFLIGFQMICMNIYII